MPCCGGAQRRGPEPSIVQTNAGNRGLHNINGKLEKVKAVLLGDKGVGECYRFIYKTLIYQIYD
jgi:hypothetical protein